MVKRPGVALSAVLFITAFVVLLYEHRDYPKPKSRFARAEVEMLMTALNAYKKDIGDYPTSDEGLHALRERPDRIENWRGPYVTKEIPPDPWGRPFRYKYPMKRGDKPEIVSYGADGLPGGRGEDADISTRE